MVGSGTRNARAISSVRKPPSARKCPRTPSHVDPAEAVFSRRHEGALLRPVRTNQLDRRMAAHDPLAEGMDGTARLSGPGRGRSLRGARSLLALWPAAMHRGQL